MSRGFLLANIDVGLLADPKFLRLARLVPEEGERACTVVVYLQTVLQSWHDGRRLTVDEAEGLWEPTRERIEALKAAGLIDAEGRIPVSAWETYYVPALERSERRREAGRQGGLASGKKRKQGTSDASAPLQRRSSDGEASLDLTPADPPSPEGEAGGGRSGLRVVGAPARPPDLAPAPEPVHMNRLDEASTASIEAELHRLAGVSDRDPRVPQLRAELAARQSADDRAEATS